MSLRDEICVGFHELPPECWTPIVDRECLTDEQFWLNQLYAVELQSSDAVDHWIATTEWPPLDSRTAYFIRIQLEYIHRFLSSPAGQETAEAFFGLDVSSDRRRKEIGRLIEVVWTRESAREWARESVRYLSPRRVYLRDPRKV